jgi:hydrogenase maturation protease
MRRGIRVVGVGSPHGDDRVGWRLVEDLAELAGPGVEAVAVAEPLGMLDHLDGCSALIVVDACRTGRAAGSAVILTWPEDRPEFEGSASTHGLNLAMVLQMADVLGHLPPSVLLFAVEVGACGPVADLSPDVACSLPELSRRLREAVEDLRRRADSAPEIGPSGNTSRSNQSCCDDRWLSEAVASARVVVPETTDRSAGGLKARTT